VILNDNNSSLEIRADSYSKVISEIKNNYKGVDLHLKEKLLENDTLLGFSKWGIYLPMDYKVQIVKERYFDFEGALNLVENLRVKQHGRN
jgi:ATP-dependent Lhr-like helicase